MINLARLSAVILAGVTQCACGLGVSQLPEVWDRGDPFATARMELQVKRAIFCELRQGALDARQMNTVERSYKGKDVTSGDDVPFADMWGAQVTFTLTADEKTSATPNVSFKEPLTPAGVFGQSVSQNFSLGVGGTLSSQGVRYDKFNFYYTAYDLVKHAGEADICHSPPTALLGPTITSSPFVDGSKLGIREWLPAAIAVSIFQRSSRVEASGEGPAMGISGSFTPDAATYNNKFVIVSEGTVTPTWNLIRVGTGTTPFLSFNRTRTHELLITIAPGTVKQEVDKKTKKTTTISSGPSAAALNAHLASEIGSAVSAAIGAR